jgi:hypothetical protein
MTRDLDLIISLGEEATAAIVKVFESDFYIDQWAKRLGVDASLRKVAP